MLVWYPQPLPQGGLAVVDSIQAVQRVIGKRTARGTLVRYDRRKVTSDATS